MLEKMRSDGIRLNNGMSIPVIGFGTYSYENDRKTTEHAVRLALKVRKSFLQGMQIYAPFVVFNIYTYGDG